MWKNKNSCTNKKKHYRITGLKFSFRHACPVAQIFPCLEFFHLSLSELYSSWFHSPLHCKLTFTFSFVHLMLLMVLQQHCWLRQSLQKLRIQQCWWSCDFSGLVYLGDNYSKLSSGDVNRCRFYGRKLRFTAATRNLRPKLTIYIPKCQFSLQVSPF